MQNEIIVTIDGREVTLVPSFRAAKELSKRYGGLLPLMDTLKHALLSVVCGIALSGCSHPVMPRVAEYVDTAGCVQCAKRIMSRKTGHHFCPC